MQPLRAPASPTSPPPHKAPPVPQGPRAYRRQIRRSGPLVAVLPPALLGAGSLLLLHDNTATSRGVAGFLAAVLAAPGLLVGGAPMKGGTGFYMIAAVGSAVLWLLIGVAAAARATRRPAGTWGDYWKEYLWLAGAVWLGVLGALIAVNLILGRAFV